MRAALVQDAVVVNVIEYDPEADWSPPDGVIVIILEEGNPVSPGWTVIENGFDPPVVVEEPVVPSTQEQLAALASLLVSKQTITEEEAATVIV